jgi:hypothetical protein
MAIKVRCPGCGKMYEVRDSLAGKKGRCTDCGSIMPIPTPAAPHLAGVDPLDLDGLGELELTATAGGASMMGVHPSAAPTAAAPAAAPAAAAAGSRAAQRAGRSQAGGASGPCIELPGGEHIDRWVPVVLITLLMGFFSILSVHGVGGTLAAARSMGKSSYDTAVMVGEVMLLLLGLVVLIPAISALLCLLGLFISSRLLKMKLTSFGYRKSLAVTSLFIVLPLARNGFNMGGSQMSVPWYIMGVAMVGLLWLLLRHRLVPFAVTLGCVAIPLGVPIYVQYQLTRPMPPAPAPKISTPTPPSPPRPSPFAVAGGKIERLTSPKPRLQSAEWAQRLERLAAAMKQHQSSHDGRLPATITELVGAGLLEDPEVIAGADWLVIQFWDLSWARPPFPSALILAEVHAEDGRYAILYADLRIETIEDEEHFARRVASDGAAADLRWRQRQR